MSASTMEAMIKTAHSLSLLAARDAYMRGRIEADEFAERVQAILGSERAALDSLKPKTAQETAHDTPQITP